MPRKVSLCPKCRSWRITDKPSPDGIEHKCQECRHEWVSKEDDTTKFYRRKPRQPGTGSPPPTSPS